MDSTTRKIKQILLDKNIKQNDICDKLGFNKGNFSTLLKKDVYKTDILEAIADAMNCDIQITFIDRDTKKEY
jgi:DNA-binding Xre family transcriptional regulator